MVCLSFVLKLGFHGYIGMGVVALVAALFILFATDAATTQSKTQIADWLAQPDLMLDASVLLTIDVAFQLCFCFMAAHRLEKELKPFYKAVYELCLWIPGILLFPALFASLAALVFATPGVDFELTGRLCAAGVFVGFPLAALLLRYLLPEREIRLELIFMLNLIIAALGIVATVNGRTAAVGTDSVEWGALGAIFVLIIAGTVAGLFVNRIKTHKKISKLQ